MITTMAAYPAALQDLPPLGQTGLTDASMNDNNNNNNNACNSEKVNRSRNYHSKIDKQISDAQKLLRGSIRSYLSHA